MLDDEVTREKVVSRQIGKGEGVVGYWEESTPSSAVVGAVAAEGVVIVEIGVWRVGGELALLQTGNMCVPAALEGGKLNPAVLEKAARNCLQINSQLRASAQWGKVGWLYALVGRIAWGCLAEFPRCKVELFFISFP